jgi:hypothetical protein
MSCLLSVSRAKSQSRGINFVWRSSCFSVFLLFFIYSFNLHAQSCDFGIWTSIGGEKKLGKWNISATAQLRTKESTGQIDRTSIQLEGSCNILKPLKAGIAYEFIYFHDSEYSDYQPRLRYSLFAQGKQDLGSFTITLREQLQRTVKDESDRIIDADNYDNYKINPEWAWRNRLKAYYNIPGFPVNPAVSVESFYLINNPEGNDFYKLRYTVSFSYKLTKHHQFEVFGLMNQRINTDTPDKNYAAGIGYVFSF